MGLSLVFVACVFDSPAQPPAFEKVIRPNFGTSAGAAFDPDQAGTR